MSADRGDFKLYASVCLTRVRITYQIWRCDKNPTASCKQDPLCDGGSHRAVADSNFCGDDCRS